ncbi:unnamed protein product [Meloidogyne enterolobii]|uniref:Uncharacterized protein n=1 Tax=Meloidogyne enterolobii TaxID=390850 RepID=A0ACB0YFD9_MELEN
METDGLGQTKHGRTRTDKTHTICVLCVCARPCFVSVPVRVLSIRVRLYFVCPSPSVLSVSFVLSVFVRVLCQNPFVLFVRPSVSIFLPFFSIFLSIYFNFVRISSVFCVRPRLLAKQPLRIFAVNEKRFRPSFGRAPDP